MVTARECVLKLKVDMVAIDALKLEVDAQTLKFSIAGAKKLKIPYENIRIESEDVLKIVIPSSMSKQDKGDSDEMFTILQMWKRALPKVIIKVNDMGAEGRWPVILLLTRTFSPDFPGYSNRESCCD